MLTFATGDGNSCNRRESDLVSHHGFIELNWHSSATLFYSEEPSFLNCVDRRLGSAIQFDVVSMIYMGFSFGDLVSTDRDGRHSPLLYFHCGYSLVDGYLLWVPRHPYTPFGPMASRRMFWV